MEFPANTPKTVLDAAILGTTDVTIVVLNELAFPNQPGFKILVDSEIMLVTYVSGRVWAVSRGQDGSTATTHSNRAPIIGLVNQDVINQLKQVQSVGNDAPTTKLASFPSGATLNANPATGEIETIPVAQNSSKIGYDAYANRPAAGAKGNAFAPSDSFELDIDDGTIWQPFGPIFRLTKPPALANFAWANQNGAIATDLNHGINFTYPFGAGGDNWSMLVKSVPTAPYTLTAGFSGFLGATTHARVGLVLRDSTSGKFIVHSFNAESTPQFVVTTYSNPTTGVANLFSQATALLMPMIWLRLKDDGTNRKYYLSPDGQNWVQIYSEGNTQFITPNQIGWGLNQSVLIPSSVNLISWAQG